MGTSDMKKSSGAVTVERRSQQRASDDKWRTAMTSIQPNKILVRGYPLDEIMGRLSEEMTVATSEESECIVVALTDELQTALANATDDQLKAVAAPWSQTEEFDRDVEVDILAEFVRELGVLARTAGERGERLYCWVCL